MILPLARQGGVNSLTGVHLQEDSGDRSLWSLIMDQNLKDSVENGVQNRRHPVLAWLPGADDGSPSSNESVAVGDLVYPSTDVSLPPFQKLRGGGTHLMDLSPFSEDEDALDPTQDGSPISHSRRRKQAGYSLAHLNVSNNINDVTPDELSMHSEDYSFHRVKLLCSYGGKILPRPTDNQLRYVGGDTRLITVSRDIHFHELMQKMVELYTLAHTIKYKLPEEDLDALVSVSSNEDVANMMEEYDRLQSSDSSPRLRLFLFSDVDHESVHLAESLGGQRSSEQRYVDAVNGISESGSKKYSGDGVSLAVAPVVVDSLIDVGDTWGFIRQQDTVPVAMLAPQISLDAASLIQHVPVALPVSSMPTMSAPSSTPSSPPLVPRVLKQGLIPEMRLSFHSDQHSNVSGHQYNIVQADGVVLEGDNYGVNVSTPTIVHEQGYSTSDLQRGLESPRKLHHEGDAVCVHQDIVACDDIRRPLEVRMPQVLSHCKLTRLSDLHLESAPSTRQRHSSQQPQLSQQHSGWQPHLFEEHTHVCSRRVELVQPASDAVAQPTAPGKPAQPTHFRSPYQNVPAAPTIDQPIYRPADHQSQGEEVFAPFMQRSVSTNTIGPLGSTAVSSIAADSAPSSPRVNYRDPSNVHASGQPQSQFFRSYVAPNYAEQQQGLRHHAHSDCVTRLGPATSPPRYRDHLGQTDEFLLRSLQQPALATTDAQQLELFLYDGRNCAHGQYSEGTAMVQVPQYHGLNPFQDGPSRFSESSFSETQDGGDGRRHREKISQQSFLPLHFNGRENFQDQSISSSEPPLVHLRYEENPMDWVVHQRGRDVDDIKSWRGGRVLTGQNGQVNEGGGADLEAPSGSFINVPEDSEDHLVISDSYRRRSTDVVEPVSSNNQHSRSIVTQSHVLPIYPFTLGQATVVDSPQVHPYVGREIDPDMLAESVPRSVEGMPDLESTSALIEVSHLQSEVLSNKSASQTDMDDKTAPGANNSLPHPSTVSSTRLEDTVLAKTAELRWEGLNVVKESRTDLQARDRSSILDHVQQFPGSAVTQGRLSSSSSGSRIEVTGEVASQRLENSSTVTHGNGVLAEEENGSTAYDFHNLILNDVMPPFSVSKGQAQVVQPMTTRVTSFTIPALSITVSTELSIPSMPSVSANTCISVGTSITEQEANSMGSLPVKPGSTTPRISQADISGVFGQYVDYREDNKVLTSQISATGHLAEDMASSVLVSSIREMPAPLQSANSMQVEDRGEWLSFSQDATAVSPANLIHAPTFSAPNWNSLQNLTTVNVEINDAHTHCASAENEDMDLQPPTVIDEDPTSTEVRLEEFAELVTDAPVPILEDLKQSFGNPGSAENAEAEAIRSGLQTILNADLEEMRELGSGTFGTVYHGKWRGTDVAIKRIKSSCFAGRPAERDRLIADFWREACTLSQLHHPNVVAFYGVVRDGPGGTLATVTEYMVNGSLKQVLQKKDRTIDRRKRLLIAMDAAFGMEYLHSKNIVHFDLKCDNLLVNMRDPHRPICKVGDLGLSKVKHQTMVSGGVRGTLPWMAPELLNGSSTLVTEKVDVFSFGIVMWELLTGEEPYASMHYGAIIGGIVNNTLRPSIPTWCDPLWKSLMEKCWSAEPTCRPSFSEVASELRVMATALQPKAHAPVNAEGSKSVAGRSRLLKVMNLTSTP